VRPAEGGVQVDGIPLLRLTRETELRRPTVGILRRGVRLLARLDRRNEGGVVDVNLDRDRLYTHAVVAHYVHGDTVATMQAVAPNLSLIAGWKKLIRAATMWTGTSDVSAIVAAVCLRT